MTAAARCLRVPLDGGKVRRHRERVAAGRCILPVEVNFNSLSAALVAAGFLDERDCDDRDKVAAAAGRVLDLLATETGF
jgi:hypothetical protein